VLIVLLLVNTWVKNVLIIAVVVATMTELVAIAALAPLLAVAEEAEADLGLVNCQSSYLCLGGVYLSSLFVIPWYVLG
jgi:hypothetical membrane protein